MVLGTNQGVSTQITQIFRQKSCVASEIRHKAFLRVKITIRHKLQVLTWIKTLRKTNEKTFVLGVRITFWNKILFPMLVIYNQEMYITIVW